MKKFVSPCPPPTPYQMEALALIVEECAEVQQRATKMMRFGVDEVQEGQDLTNADRLADEVGDLIAVLERAAEVGLIPWSRVGPSVEAKYEKLKVWLQNRP